MKIVGIHLSIGGVSNRLGGQIHVTHWNDYTNHSLVKSKLGSLKALGMAKTNQTDIFFSFIVKLTLKICKNSLETFH